MDADIERPWKQSQALGYAGGVVDRSGEGPGLCQRAGLHAHLRYPPSSASSSLRILFTRGNTSHQVTGGNPRLHRSQRGPMRTSFTLALSPAIAGSSPRVERRAFSSEALSSKGLTQPARATAPSGEPTARSTRSCQISGSPISTTS